MRGNLPGIVCTLGPAAAAQLGPSREFGQIRHCLLCTTSKALAPRPVSSCSAEYCGRTGCCTHLLFCLVVISPRSKLCVSRTSEDHAAGGQRPPRDATSGHPIIRQRLPPPAPLPRLPRLQLYHTVQYKIMLSGDDYVGRVSRGESLTGDPEPDGL